MSHSSALTASACAQTRLTMPCVTLLGCLNGTQPGGSAVELPVLALQAHPFLHAALDLSRLPVGSIPAFGSALPFNMVSWLPLICETDVGVGVHQLQSALPCRSTHAAMLSDLGLPTSAGSGLACRQPGQCLLKTLSAADQSSGSKCKSSPLQCSTLPMAVYLWRMLWTCSQPL